MTATVPPKKVRILSVALVDLIFTWAVYTSPFRLSCLFAVESSSLTVTRLRLQRKKVLADTS